MIRYLRITTPGALLLLGAGLLLLTGCSTPDGEVMTPAGTAQPHRYRDYAGERLYINYWAEWCTPCRAEIPELNALNELEGHRVLGRNFDGISGAELARLMNKMGVAFPVLLSDPAERFRQPVPSVLPTTLVIGADGELLTVLVGPQTVESLMEAGGA